MKFAAHASALSEWAQKIAFSDDIKDALREAGLEEVTDVVVSGTVMMDPNTIIKVRLPVCVDVWAGLTLGLLFCVHQPVSGGVVAGIVITSLLGCCSMVTGAWCRLRVDPSEGRIAPERHRPHPDAPGEVRWRHWFRGVPMLTHTHTLPL